jgi:hypothetical protein
MCGLLVLKQTILDLYIVQIPGTFPIGRCWGGERARKV